jgi:hypothetical protein
MIVGIHTHRFKPRRVGAHGRKAGIPQPLGKLPGIINAGVLERVRRH